MEPCAIPSAANALPLHSKSVPTPMLALLQPIPLHPHLRTLLFQEVIPGPFSTSLG